MNNGKALICCDSFKGSLSSLEVNDQISNLLNKVGIETDSFEIADGGEGLLDSLKPSLKDVEVLNIETVNQAGEKIIAEVLVSDGTAYLESAKVVGLNLIPLEKRQIFNLNTKGLGILTKELYYTGIKKFAVGLGGSGTNDYGTGWLQGMGYHFFDEKNQEIEHVLPNIDQIKSIQTDEDYSDLTFYFISDIISPAVGKFGSAQMFGPQKNASKEEVILLENLAHQYINLLNTYNEEITTTTPYVGAAGGMSLSLKTFFNCEFVKGAQFILDLNNFSDRIKDYDYIVTGEGKFDLQSLQGKIVGEIYDQVKNQKPVIVFTGVIDFEVNDFKEIADKKDLVLYSCAEQENYNDNFMNKEVALKNIENCVLKFIQDNIL